MRSIIISRTDKIGDVILTLPMLAQLKQLLPDCKIIFLCRSYTKPILECNTLIDQIVDWDEIDGLTTKQRVERLKSLEADAIIHVFPHKKIAQDSFRAGIPLRIGTSHRLWHWLYCNKLLNFSRKNSELHESQLNLKLLFPLGYTQQMTTKALSEITLFDSVPQVDETVLSYLDKNRTTLIFHPHSRGSAREWPIEYYVELCNLLPEEKYNIVFCGTAEEEKTYNHALSGIKRAYLNAGGKLSLKQYISLISCAEGLVAASTGPLHIAAACGIYAFGIYPPIRPMHPGRWAPIGKNVHVFVAQKECSDCRKSMPCHCMAEIEPQIVFKKINESFDS